MKMTGIVLATLFMLAPLLAHADPQVQTSQNQASQSQAVQTTPGQAVSASTSQTSQDVFSYSYLQINRLSEYSDFFGDRSAGNGLKFSYSFDSGVYLFGQWNRLDFDKLPGHHDLTGIGVGAHQSYSQSTSFYIDLGFLRDQLSGSLGGAKDYYWRVDYGFQSHLSSFISLSGAIFTERNTDFGRRPFGEHLGLSFGGSIVALEIFGEHTADGNRMEADLNWYY
ncbi:MAG: hypothetical protein WBR15_02990 [Gammaproteobacteria bacterium]